MLKNAVQALKTFHRVMEISKEQSLSGEYCEFLNSIRFKVETLAHYAEAYIEENDSRYLRIHLMLEELGEAVASMINGDEVALLDALTDLVFVTIGTAVTFDLPISEAFNEIYDANMTKTPKLGPRLRDKGEMYIPPDLEKIFKEHRKQ